MPDLEKKMMEADEEILQWVNMAQEEAIILSADREVEPITKEIAEEDQALEPLNTDQADSDDELVKINAVTLDDRLDARHRNFSEAEDQKWQDPSYDTATHERDFTFEGWDVIPDDERPAGVVASAPVVEDEKELDIDELEAVVSEEVIEVDEGFQDADEGQAEAFDDDDDDLAVVGSFKVIKDDGPTARGDPVPMDVDSESKDTKGKSKAGQSSSKSVSHASVHEVEAQGQTGEEGHAEAQAQEDWRSAWTEEGGIRHLGVFLRSGSCLDCEPDNMIGIPSRNVEGGRLGSISHAMSDYLRGHRLFHRRPSPDIRRSVSMDFRSLVRHLQGDFPHLKDRKSLWSSKIPPCAGSASRCSYSYGTLKWTPCRIRAIQGHRQFLVE